MTLGSRTLTYHLAYLAVVLFMFLSVSVFFGGMCAGRAWRLRPGQVWTNKRRKCCDLSAKSAAT